MLEIKVFGELEVRRGKRVVALPASKKSRALLAYLVVTARPHLREALCDLLWIGPDDPRAALRWSLTKIRGVVDTRLVADRERVSFEPGSSTTIDLVTARSLVAADVTAASIDALKRAAELTRGELLEGLDLVDCYRFHEWCVGEREAARALRVSILATLASRLEDTPEEALAVARARVAVDPLSEAAHEAVIRILGKLGKKREALAQFDTCRRILQTELGAKPSASLLHARATLAPQTGASETPPPPARATPPRDAALLVGRKVERDEIAARVRGAAAHVAQPFLLFAGEAGIGKTRLLEVCGDAMRAAGGAVLAGRAFEAESVRPYGPWIDALSGARVPDPLGPAGAPAAQDQRRLFDAVGELVSGLAARAPLAILLDDLQWFDEASLALLHALSRSLPPHVLFVCAARPAELADNVIAQRLVHALTRESRLVRHDLTPLAEAEVTELATALGAAAEGARIFGESGGHPFFAVEIARALARGDAALPPTLTALIDDRLSRLGALAKSLLPWAAAMRRGFELDVLARATNLPASEVLEGARELEAHRVLEERAVGGGYDFAHDLLRSATYRKLSEPRRRWIHLQLSRALSSGGGGASEIAHHAGLGGDHELAARAALDAAQAALRVFANGEAASLGRLGVEHAASLPRDTRLPLQVGLLDVVVHSGAHSSRPRELEDEVLRVVTECEAAGLGALASAGLHTLAVAQRDRGGVESAFANAVRASEVHETTDPGARALRLSATAKCLTLLEREMPRARVMLDEAQELAREAEVELLDLHWGQGLLHLFEGNREASAKELTTALELAGREEHRWSEFECLMYLTMIDLEDERPEDALVHGDRLLELAEKMREGSEVAAAAALRALASLMLGREGAEAEVLAAASALRAVDAKGMLSYVLSGLARAEVVRGLFAEAYAHAEEALRAATTVKRRSDEALARVLLVRAAAGRGDQGLARGHLAELRTGESDGVTLSARARREVLELASLSTMTPTLATT